MLTNEVFLMNINIYLENSLAKQLKDHTKLAGKPRNAIIREAIKEWIEHHQIKQWPKSVLNYKGCSGIPSFESSRKDLLPPNEDPFA
ncbi:MAG: CopG family transcriptional regulator [Gammaproteobacteria bacterium]|nr:MAG: CopG family transcriptional regulator [Gammaproteobacteria bacterium]